MGRIKELLWTVLGSGVTLVYFALMIGPIYWLWIAIQIGSVGMFFLGFFPPFMLVTAPVGLYSLLFGVPDWIFNTFASTSIVS